MASKPLMEKWDFIILLGESGGGKGTLVNSIKKYWVEGLHSASMGDIYREKAKTDPVIRDMTEQGILIDDAVTGKIFREFAESNAPGLIDGYPRNRQQAIDLIKFIKGKGWRILAVDLNCNIDKIIERLLARNRADDKLSIVYKRHTDHMNLHPSVMEEIKNRPDLFDVITLNGNLHSDIVFSNFLLDVLRLVDVLYFYSLCEVNTSFKVDESESTINPAINRWICGFLKNIQEIIQQH
ncbi:MAG: nucleoside monophosphate kinase [Defluviitaleaceae bacterium]|nr:nucleoside monophosphate kinase [Defluviitaleaceae bacterium]